MLGQSAAHGVNALPSILSVRLSVRGQDSLLSKAAQHAGSVDYTMVGNGKIIASLCLTSESVLCEDRKTCLSTGAESSFQ